MAPVSKGPSPAQIYAEQLAAQDVPAVELSPDEKRREELLALPDFARYVKLMKMKVPVLSILNQVRAAGIYQDDDICLFISPGEITKLKNQKEYKGTKYL